MCVCVHVCPLGDLSLFCGSAFIRAVFSPHFLPPSLCCFQHRAAQHAASEAARGVPPKQLLFRKGDVVHARRKKLPALDWAKGNIQLAWHVAEITKVRTKGDTMYDLKYVADGAVVKKVPAGLFTPPKQSVTEVMAVVCFPPLVCLPHVFVVRSLSPSYNERP